MWGLIGRLGERGYEGDRAVLKPDGGSVGLKGELLQVGRVKVRDEVAKAVDVHDFSPDRCRAYRGESSFDIQQAGAAGAQVRNDRIPLHRHVGRHG